MEFLTGVFILILAGIIGDTIVKTAKTRTKSKLQPEQRDLEELKHQVQQQATLLADAQAVLGEQAEQIDELHERLEFTERVLLQARNRPELPDHSEPSTPPGS